MFERTAFVVFLGSVVLWTGEPAATRETPPQARTRGTDGAVAPTSVPGMPIVAGCALPDCYPAPLVPATLDWELTVSGPAGSDVVLGFQPAVAEALRHRGTVGGERWGTPAELHVPVGTLVLRGMPAGPDRAAIVEPRAAAPPGGRISDPVSLVVKQFAGGVAVAGYSFTWTWPLAGPVSMPGGDLVKLSGKADPWPSVVLLDALPFEAGCLNDALRTAVSPQLGVANFQPPTSACPSSEIGVFSTCNGMALQPPLPAWTAGPHDEATVKLPQVAEIPVTFWDMRESSCPPSDTDVATEIETDLQRANVILSSMGVGIRFRAGEIRCKVDLDEAPTCDPDLGAAWEAFFFRVGHHENAVNVYYRPEQTGLGCFPGGEAPGSLQQTPAKQLKRLNSALIFRDANNATLAHELAHVLSLRLEYAGSWPASNIMGGGGEARNCVTIGQAFRANMNWDSAVNRLGYRMGQIRSCAESVVSDECPSRTLDTPRQLPSWFGSFCGASAPRWGPDEVTALLDWLECDDCAVPALGSFAPGIIRALEALLEEGPSPARRTLNRIHLEQAHALLRAYADTCETGPLGSRPISKEQYMRIYEPRLAVRVRIKAATALAEIGSPEAREVLKRALSRNLPANVKAYVADLLARPPRRPR